MLGIDLYTDLTDEQRDAIVDSIARKIVQRRLEMPVILLLETHKPLSFLASQGLLVAMPFLIPLIGPERIADFSKLLRKRENIDLLIQRIENMAAGRGGLESTAAEGQG